MQIGNIFFNLHGKIDFISIFFTAQTILRFNPRASAMSIGMQASLFFESCAFVDRKELCWFIGFYRTIIPLGFLAQYDNFRIMESPSLKKMFNVYGFCIIVALQ